jgi:hypothetical protein
MSCVPGCSTLAALCVQDFHLAWDGQGCKGSWLTRLHDCRNCWHFVSLSRSSILVPGAPHLEHRDGYTRLSLVDAFELPLQ